MLKGYSSSCDQAVLVILAKILTEGLTVDEMKTRTLSNFWQYQFDSEYPAIPGYNY